MKNGAILYYQTLHIFSRIEDVACSIKLVQSIINTMIYHWFCIVNFYCIIKVNTFLFQNGRWLEISLFKHNKSRETFHVGWSWTRCCQRKILCANVPRVSKHDTFLSKEWIIFEKYLVRGYIYVDSIPLKRLFSSIWKWF